MAIAGAFVIGLVLGAARAHRVPVVSQFTAVYVEVIRNTPILVLIFMIFYGLPELGITFDAFTVAWLSVMLWGGAFNSENFRAGFLAVSQRHREAAYALGFGPLGTFLNVTLPLGGRIALPSSINTYISVIKNTSLMYVDRLPGADDDGDQHQQPDAGDGRGADAARDRLPDARVEPLVGYSPARTPPGASGGRAECPTGRGRSPATSCTRGCRTRFASPRSPSSGAR